MILEADEYEVARDNHHGYCSTCDALTADQIPPGVEFVNWRLCPVCNSTTLHGVEAAAQHGYVEVPGIVFEAPREEE